MRAQVSEQVLRRQGGFDQHLGFWQPPTILNTVSAVLFVACCVAIGYVVLTATQRPRLMQVAFLVVAAFLLTNNPPT